MAASAHKLRHRALVSADSQWSFVNGHDAQLWPTVGAGHFRRHHLGLTRIAMSGCNCIVVTVVPSSATRPSSATDAEPSACRVAIPRPALPMDSASLAAYARTSGVRCSTSLGAPVAREVAPWLLLPTPAISGQASSPRSHWWYRLDADRGGQAKCVTHVRGDGATLMELRADHLNQTAVPQTVHPSGETVCWQGEAWGAQRGDPGLLALAG